MSSATEATLLRVFLSEADRHHHRPLYEVIVERARASHLAGATVLRGPLGFGHSSRLHTAKLLDLSADMAIVVEIVDEDARIRAFLPELGELMESTGGGGLATLERVQILHFDKP